MPLALLAALALLLSCCSAPAAEPDAGAPGAGSGRAPASGGCRRTGCSGQVCSDEPVVTTCEWKPEYECYREATCARGPGGACAWVQDEALRACLERARKERGGR